MKKTPKQSLPKPRFHYDIGVRRYWAEDTTGTWIQISESSLLRHLLAAGFSSVPFKDGGPSPLEREIVRIQVESNVSFAGELAGYAKGIREICGRRILITASRKSIEPVAGEFPLLAQILDGMFNDPRQDQRPFVLGWLKHSLEALRAGRLRPAQVLAMAGARDTFKSSLQNLITLMLGGRAAKPYRYMAGLTHFNKDLFAAEHLMIEDEVASVGIRARRHFATRIKDFTVNEVQSCHAKGRDAISLRPFWRVTISLNDEPENLLILPPIDEGLADKIILLKVKPFAMPMATGTLEERQIFWNALVAELPAFLAYLETWQIAPQFMSQRFGINHYHHPEILGALDALAPETRLLALIDATVFENPFCYKWQGTAAELERVLVSSSMGFEARKLLDWENAAGTYLGRLARRSPERIKPERASCVRSWLILRHGGQ
jgi:hypothetical protein